ncbi:MAG: glycosyltransferase family 39 protein [Alphaproteobacteria bacterium]|nr:glycosyltransferase family 39 protein [Alphaproteobacteria bacterium]
MAPSLAATSRLGDTIGGGLAATAVLLLAAVLRLHDLDADAFWKNELFSMVWIRHPVDFLLGEGARIETNPPLYFLLLKGWTALFGTSEFAARMPSLLAGVAAVGLTMRLGRELAGPAIGLLAGLLLAITPVQIIFAHEARAYALLPVFALLAMLGANRLLRAAEAAPGLPPISAPLLFAVGCAGLMHSHATGVFAVTALGLATLVGLAGAAAPRPALLRLIGAGAFAVLLAAPVLLAMAAQSGSANIGWMPKFGLDTPVIVNRYLLVGPMVRTDLGEEGSRVELLSEMALGTVTALTLILMSLREIRAGRPRALLVVFPLLFVTLLALVSLARPVLIPRVALWVSVPICLAAAMVLTGRLAWWLRAAAGMLLAACIAVGLWNNVAAPAQHKPDWRALLAAQPPGIAGPVLVAGPHAGPLGIAFYADGPIVRKLHHWTPDPTLPATTADRLERTTSGATPVDTAAIGDLIAAGQRVVLYLDDDDEILIGRHLEAQPWFAAARRGTLPGLLLFEW